MALKQSGVAVIGGGIMGGDIATIYAASGWNVHVMSPSAKTRDALPAHLVPLVEIIRAEHTDQAVVDWLEQNQRELGKAPVCVNKDIPGFLGNRLQHAMMREALYLVADGVVSPEAVDTAVRYGFGFRFLACGPMLQKERSGWDTNFYAGNSVYPHLYGEKMPPQFLKDMVAKCYIGMKTRRGLWEWTDESVAREKARIEKLLQAALQILQTDSK